MKKLFFTTFFMLFPIMVPFLKAETVQEAYVRKYCSLAISEMNRTGIPASITLAQGLLESSAGQSALAVKGNNHFGIKCHSDWNGRKMYKDDDAINECFRVYPTVEQSYQDHSDFLRYRDRYKLLFELNPQDYKAWAEGLKAAGYATDPAYPAKLCSTIEKYGLHKYDKGIPVPESPLHAEEPAALSTAIAEQCSFKVSTEMKAENGVPFTVASSGQTYRDIALEYGLFLKEILHFNDEGADRILEDGETIYLQKKKSRAAKGLEKYIVENNNEHLRDIAQRFGVTLKALCKMNGCSADKTLNAGDTIILR